MKTDNGNLYLNWKLWLESLLYLLASMFIFCLEYFVPVA